MIALLRLISLMFGLATEPTADAEEYPETTSPRVAQVQLAEVLAAADAIESVAAHGRVVRFTIVRDGELRTVAATTSRRGEVEALAVKTVGEATAELHGLTWLASELAEVTAVTRLIADEDGAVTLTTSDGRRYMAIPGRGSGGNAAVEARWAAAWNHEQ